MAPRRVGPPRLLPAWIPDLQSAELQSFLEQKRQPAFIPLHARELGTEWKLELQNHGGGGEGLVVDLVGPAFKKPALEVLQGEAFFLNDEHVHRARRTRLKDGYRFTFDALPLSPPPKKKRSRSRTLEAFVEGQLRSALGAGPYLRFLVKALSTPSRKPLALSVVAKPENQLERGFTLSAWCGRPELMFSDFF